MHRTSQIDKLSPEMRRCVSMAIELITRATLLVIEDLTGRLDVPQANHLMAICGTRPILGCVVVMVLPL